MSEVNIYDSQEWFQLPDEDKTKVMDNHFKDLYSNDPDYINADPQTQEKYRTAFKRYAEESALNSQFNPIYSEQQENQQTADSRGWFSNSLALAKNSVAEQVQHRSKMVSSLQGETDPEKLAQHVVALHEKRLTNPMTHQQKKVADDIEKLMAVWESPESGKWDKTKATAQFIATGIIGNPAGVVHTGAESTSSLVAYGIGAWGGGKLGAAAGPKGALVGSAAGMISGATLDAGTHKFQEEITTTMQEQGYEITPTNVVQFLEKNPGFIEKTQRKSVQYGAVLGLIDTATGGLIARLATLPTRAAREAAVRSIDAPARAAIRKAASESGVPVRQVMESMVDARAIAQYKARPLKQKLVQMSGAYAGQVISEPIAEGGATLSVGDPLDARELIYETVGGMGAGPIGAAINVTALGSKAGSKKSANLIKKIMTDTPQHKQEIKNIKSETTKAKKLKDKRAEHNFNKDIENIEITDSRINDWADPKHKEYNPVKAVTALAKFENDVDATDKAQDILNPVLEDLFTLQDRIDELKSKGENITPQEAQLVKKLSEQLDVKMNVARQVQKQVDKIQQNNEIAAADNQVPPINIQTATTEEVVQHASETYGSSKPNLDIKQLDQRLNRTDLPDTERALLQSMKEATEARQTLEDLQKSPNTEGKTLAQVQNDIYRGSHDFKGINSFKQAISNFLKIGNIAKAKNQIEGLKKFRDSRIEKRDQFTKAFKEISKVTYNPKTEKRPEIKLRVGNTTYRIHNKSGRLIEAVVAEADALTKEVTAAENLLVAKTSPTKANTQAAAPSPAQSKPEASSKSAVNQASELGLNTERFNAIPVGRQSLALINAKKLKDVGINPNEMWGKTQPQIDRLIKKQKDSKQAQGAPKKARTKGDIEQDAGLPPEPGSTQTTQTKGEQDGEVQREAQTQGQAESKVTVNQRPTKQYSGLSSKEKKAPNGKMFNHIDFVADQGIENTFEEVLDRTLALLVEGNKSKYPALVAGSMDRVAEGARVWSPYIYAKDYLQNPTKQNKDRLDKALNELRAKVNKQTKEQTESQVEDKQAPESSQDQQTTADPTPTTPKITKTTLSTKQETFNRTTNKGSEQIKGRELLIPEFENYPLVVYKDKNGWNVIEQSTGLAIGVLNSKLQKDAVKQAEHILNEQGTLFKQLVDKHNNKNKKESTNKDNTDNVVTESMELVDPNQLPVTYTDINGIEVTKPYNQAMIDITTAINESKEIIACIGKKT